MQTQFISRPWREIASIIVAGIAMLWAPAAALAEANWTPLATANSPSNVHHDATYDSANQRIVLCGRRPLNGQAESYFYSVAGGWQTGPSITSTGGADIEVSYDPNRVVTVLYTVTSSIPVVFELVGNLWTQRSFATLPVACEDGALLRYDPVRRKTVLVGATNLGATANSQTWLWDGTNWTQVLTSPPGAAGGSMTFDEARGVMVLLPFYGTNTWTFNGTAWTPQPATNVPIPGVWVAKMAFDPINELAIEFGGEAAGPAYPTNAWAWNGSVWQMLTTSNYPPSTIDMAFLWFPPLNAMIMHGGWGPGDSWAWRNSLWVFSNAPALAAPQGVTASDGTYQDKVAVTWQFVSGATGYRVYRSESNDTASAGLLGTSIVTTNYDDTSSTAGTLYYYWVKATNASGLSSFSSSDSGYRSGLSPAAPGNVAASDGTFADKVQVTWSAVSNATGYTLWRSGTNDTNSASLLAGGIATTNYDDTSSVVNVTNYYWVKTTNSFGTSSFSSSDAGWRSNVSAAAAGPTILANGQADSITVSASNTVTITVAFGLGSYPTDVDVDWWVLASASYASWYYMNSTPEWVPAAFTGNNYSVLHPVYQGPLADVPSTTVLPEMTLPPGIYYFWFAVDYPADGVLDPGGQMLYDQVTVTVQ